MQKRERLLLGLVLLLLALYLADQGHRRFYTVPLEREQTLQQSLSDEFHQTRLQIRREQQKLARLPQIEQRSLPRDLDMAVTSYRSWLLAQLEKAQIRQATIDSSQPANVANLYRRIDFTIRCQGDLFQVTQLLCAVHQAHYLHRIRSMTLTPIDTQRVDIAMTIEALSLTTATQTDALDPSLAAFPDSDQLSHYLVIAQRNLFASGPSPLAEVALTAVTQDASGRRQAWLSDRRSGKTLVVSEGDEVPVRLLRLQVVHIEPDQIIAELNGRRVTIRVGRSLASP